MIVAGGGGGADAYTQDDSDGSGGYGGGETAGDAICNGQMAPDVAGAGQTGDEKFFGQGENVLEKWNEVAGESVAGSWKAIGGGGGGWYGGRVAAEDFCGGAGGSGFVFKSLEQEAVKALRDKYKVSEQYILSNARTYAGNEEFLSPDGTMETGHKGNGVVRITLLKDY